MTTSNFTYCIDDQTECLNSWLVQDEPIESTTYDEAMAELRERLEDAAMEFEDVCGEGTVLRARLYDADDICVGEALLALDEEVS